MRLKFRLALLLLATAALPVRAGEKLQGTVTKVLSGDSLEIKTGDKTQVFELAGIDAPEPAQDYAKESKALLTKTALGKKVTYEILYKLNTGETCIYAFLENGSNLSYIMLDAGLVWWFRAKHPDDRQLDDREHKARKKNLYIWKDHAPLPPWAFRARERDQKGEPPAPEYPPQEWSNGP